MSRSNLPKSRTDKGKATSATPAVTHEIIPGKYNDQDWNFMLDHDDGEEFVFDIVEEVCSAAMDIIFKAHIEKELIPYTVTQAKDAILQIIEWQFLCRDSGELNVHTDCGWIEDEEPEPAMTDCWAQGSVPTQRVTPRVAPIPEMDEEAEAQCHHVTPPPGDEDIIERVSTASHGEEQQLEDNSLSAEGTEILEETTPSIEHSSKQGTPDSQKSSVRKKSFKPKGGKLPLTDYNKMTESLEASEMREMKAGAGRRSATPSNQQSSSIMPASCHSILKLQAGRPPGNRDVLYDNQGNVISVFRIDPEKLPNHKVRTTFRVVDPAVEAAQARLEAMRTGRKVETDRVPRPPNAAKPSHTRGFGISKTTSKTQTVISASSKFTGKSIEIAPLPPPMVDTMDLMPGVVVKEGDRVKRGPKPYGRKMELMLGALHHNLKPMSSSADLPTLAVAELLEHQTPVIKPLIDNTPIPPIAAQAQYS